jgi:endonuclease/exonuclease/phosphatase family metal-dependent hydrolase
MKSRAIPLVFTATLVAGVLPAAAASAASTPRPSSPMIPITVMTRNMDLGSDYAPVFVATDGPSFAQGVTTIYNEVLASNIPERAAGIAKEIAQTMPTAVSLQEVSLVQQLTPTPAGLVVDNQIDQLAELQRALQSLGAHYAVASRVDEFDVTAPSDAGYLVRVRDGEAVLVRSDLPRIITSSNPQSGHFTNPLTLQTPVGAIPALRGWASVDVTTSGSTVRVIATHLELSADVATAEAGELLAGPANTRLPVVLAGDLNSGPGTTTGAYDAVAAAMTDTWTATRPGDDGYTLALHGEDYFAYATTPTSRIDLIFVRGLQPVLDIRIGTNDLTPSGLYPSDHAGVVALALSPVN